MLTGYRKSLGMNVLYKFFVESICFHYFALIVDFKCIYGKSNIS